MSFGRLYEIRQEKLAQQRRAQQADAASQPPTSEPSLRPAVSPRRRAVCDQGHTWRDAKGQCVLCKTVEVEPDQLYRNFAYTFKPGYKREIHSKRQFLRECKATGQRSVSADDLLKRGVPYHPDPMEAGLPREAVQQAFQDAKKSATPERIQRHWHEQEARRHG